MYQPSMRSIFVTLALFSLSSHGCSVATVDVEPSCVDRDQDGYGEGCVAGPDCDDTRRSVAPGEAENCADGVDNNCDGATDGADSQCSTSCADADSDGYRDVACGGTDCYDNVPDINPAAVESCSDGVDNDCDDASDGADPDCAAPTCVVAAASWQSQALPQAQTGSFAVEFVSTPSRAQMDSVIGLSSGMPAQYSDLAAIVRFAATGVIDARDGDSYQADAVVSYAAGVPYGFRLVVDVVSHTYDVFVSPDGGAEVALATGYAFRSEQSTVTVLTHWAVTAAVGSQAMCDFTFTGGPACADVDEDGYHDQLCGGTDCNDALASVYPGAMEVCGDGTDQDCSGEDLACPACGNAAVAISGCTCAGVRYTDGVCCTDTWYSDGYCCAGTWQANVCNGSSSCPYGSALPDGCADAPSGTPQLPHLLDVQQVTALNIIPGSGYTNGTHTWTASGGGGSGATGTITVVNGALGGATGLQYTITDQGTGYTDRPTIAVPAGAGAGSGGSIVPTVYQATPHNAATPWNMPGVDYYVGVPSGTVLKDPTIGANLPAGATFSGHTVTVTGCNVTLDGFDFTLHDTALVINVTGTGCTTTIQNSNQHALSNTLTYNPIADLTSLGSGGAFVYQRNEYDGLAPYGVEGGSGFGVNAPICCRGNVTLMYNYFHNFDAKIIQMSGTTPSSPLVERYNLFADFGSCGGSCAHGEAEYTYAGSPGTVSFTGQFNTYILHMHAGTMNLTAPHAVEANSLIIDGTSDDHNVVLAQGPQNTCGGNPTYYVAAAAVFDGSQSTSGFGSLRNMTFDHNYIDASGAYFPWYHHTANGSTMENVTWTNNVDAGTGNDCN